MDIPANAPADFVTALSVLKVPIALSLIAGLVILGGLWLVTRYLEHRWTVKREAIEAARTEKGKIARAALFAKTLENMTSEVQGLRSDVRRQTDRIEKRASEDDARAAKTAATMDGVRSSTDALQSSLAILQATIRDMSTRQTGGLNRADSMRLIEQVINEIVLRDTIDILTFSMQKNNYAERAKFIVIKVRTELGKSIMKVAAILREYRHLSISPAYYLRYYNDAGGIRFHVCDEVWSRIEPLYQNHHRGDEAQLEEMRTTVGNIFADLVTQGRRAAEDYYVDNRDQDPDPAGVFRSAATDDIPQGYRRTRSDPAIPALSIGPGRPLR